MELENKGLKDFPYSNPCLTDNVLMTYLHYFFIFYFFIINKKNSKNIYHLNILMGTFFGEKKYCLSFLYIFFCEKRNLLLVSTRKRPLLADRQNSKALNRYLENCLN